MHDPPQRAETDQPEHASPGEKEQRGEKSALNQLTKTRNQETGQCGDDVSG